MNGNGEYIQCLLCGRQFRAITWLHLKIVHGTTTEDYADYFPGEPMQCEELVEERVSQIRGIPRDYETCLKISLTNMKWWKSPEGERLRERLSNNPHQFGR